MRKRTLLSILAVLAVAFAFLPFGSSVQAEPFSPFTSGDLTIGSRGQAVIDLQGVLAEMGYLVVPQGTPLGYFGNLTKGALMKFQAMMGVPQTGYYGSMTRTALFSHFASRNWIDGSGNLAINSGTGQASAAGNVASASGSNPYGSTGYWYNGNWYNSMPSGAAQSATSTGPAVAGYWYNGTWYSTNAGSNIPSQSVAANQAASQTGLGYWYNGVWTPVTGSALRGYYSTNQGSQASGIVTGTNGYWYNGIWYPTNTPNIGGGGSATSTSSSDSTATSTNTSLNVNPAGTGYWLNGTWYASSTLMSTTSPTGMPGYMINGTWYYTDGSTATYYQ